MPGRVKYRGSAAARPRCAARTGRWSMISQAPIFTIHAELADVRHFGQTPYGERRGVDILRGRGGGARAQGKNLSRAGWQKGPPHRGAGLQGRFWIGTEYGARGLLPRDRP